MKYVIVVILALSLFALANGKPKTPCPGQPPVACFVNWTPQDCMKEGKVYVPASCTVPCAYCADKKEIIEDKSCDPSICSRAFCVNQTIEQCKPGQVLVPRDGVCYCCDVCKYN